jgi:hypothetical protein
LPGVALVPAPVEILRDRPKLDSQVVRQILRLNLAALLPPKPQQGSLIVTHNDPGIRAANEGAPV